MCFVSEMKGFGYYFTVLGGTASQQAALLKKDAVVSENKEAYGDSEHSSGSYKAYDLAFNTKAKLDVNSGSCENIYLKAVSELSNVNESNETCKAESSEVVVKRNEEKYTELSSDILGNVVLRRESNKSGPRPTTFPLCLLQPEVISSSPEAHKYIQQLEEMGQVDVTELKGLNVPESMTEEDERKNNGAEEMGSDAGQSCRKLSKSSSYENLYDRADLRAAACEDTPSTAKLSSTLGDPFTTKTQLPPEMCSSFENLYQKAQSADEKVVREADYLAAGILEEAIQEAARGQMQSAAHYTHTSVSSGSEVPLPGEAMGHKGCFQTNSKKSDSEGIVVV